MAEASKIEWCDHTFNPWEGCQKVSCGCDHCYAETRNARYNGTAVNWGPGAPRRRTSAANWKKPLKWNREAEAFAAVHGRKQRVFCASLADVFDNAVDPAWRADLFALIDATPMLDWLLLTKRIGNVAAMLAEMGRECLPVQVWLGATVVNQAEADRDIPKLLSTPAAVRFVSIEPMLGPVDLRWIAEPDEEKDGVIDSLLGCNWIDNGRGEEFRPVRPGHEDRIMHRWVCSAAADILAGRKLDWVICGGESGPGARPMHPDWARSLRDQCAAAGVPLMFKQWGEWMPTGSADIYRHGPERNQREFPKSPGISWLADGRICLRDYSVAEHQQRIKDKVATCSRAVEVDLAALAAFHATLDDPAATPVGYQWMYRVGKARAGRLLDGREWSEFPA